MDMRHRRTRSALTAAALLFSFGAAGQARAEYLHLGEGAACTTPTVAVVPEPSTAALMSVAVAGLVGFGLRKKKRTD